MTIERDVHIAGVGSELQGVGRAADGRALFAFGALPGERADVRIVRDGGRFLVGEAERLIELSPRRVDPPCPHFGCCGGCAAQHMDYALSLELKAQKVRDALQRIGGLGCVDVRETIPSPQLWRYRNKAEYAARGGALGVMERAGHGVIPARDCLLQHEASVALLNAVRDWGAGELAGLVTRVNREGRLMGILCARQGGRAEGSDGLFADVPALASLHTCALNPRPSHALDGACRLVRGEQRLAERICGLDYALSPHSFFQINRPQAEALVAELLRALALAGGEVVADLYCGIGTLTLPLARTAAHVVGVEIVAPAVEDARRAAEINGIRNVEFIHGDAGTELARLAKSGLRPDAVVVDPPRKGLDPSLVRKIVACAPAKIGYVSCDCATLARDARLLVESGRYALQSAQPIDMFPWTEHVETVALMSRVQ